MVYGSVQTYEAYYLGLIAAWHVGVEMTMLSTHTGEPLVEANGMRYDTNLLVALTMEDIAISSAENLLQLRDINLARTEEETCREIIHRIPFSKKLQDRNQQAALTYATASDPKFDAATVQASGATAGEEPANAYSSKPTSVKE